MLLSIVMFAEAQVLASGIEYGTLMITESSPPLEVRIRGAMNQILGLYNIPQEIRQQLIEEALQQDYCAVGRQIFADFMAYIEQVNEQILEDLLNPKKEVPK